MNFLYPQRLSIEGYEVMVHADWCPIEKLRQSIAGPFDGLILDAAAAEGLRCRCHLRPLAGASCARQLGDGAVWRCELPAHHDLGVDGEWPAGHHMGRGAINQVVGLLAMIILGRGHIVRFRDFGVPGHPNPRLV